MASEGENSWKFAQCFGDKGEVEDITEGSVAFSLSPSPSDMRPIPVTEEKRLCHLSMGTKKKTRSKDHKKIQAATLTGQRPQGHTTSKKRRKGRGGNQTNTRLASFSTDRGTQHWTGSKENTDSLRRQ
jgi:hypothetical protein